MSGTRRHRRRGSKGGSTSPAIVAAEAGGLASVVDPNAKQRRGRSAKGLFVMLLQVIGAMTVGVFAGAKGFEVFRGPIVLFPDPLVVNATAHTHGDQWVCRPLLAPPRVVWNRVNKCGGEALGAAITSCAKQLGYTYAISQDFDFFRTANDNKQHRVVAKEVMRGDLTSGVVGGKAVHLVGAAPSPHGRRPLLYTQSMGFADFSQWGLAQPEYINLLRHPLERFVQNYQQMQKYQSRKPKKFPCTWNATLDQCLTQRRTRSCMGSCGTHNLLTKSLCGTGPQCGDASSKGALEMALHNLQYRYAAVGILEFLPTTAGVFERVLPSYFSGLTEALKRRSLHHVTGIPTPLHPTPALSQTELSRVNRRYLAEVNANDIKLYRAAVRLLQRRARACGVELVRTGEETMTADPGDKVTSSANGPGATSEVKNA